MITEQARIARLKSEAERSQRRLAIFNNSLPWVYRSFDLTRAPNPSLCEHLFKYWRNWNTVADTDDADSQLFGCDDRRGLLLYGAPRSGKTRFACEAVRRKIADAGDNADARFISAVQWGNETSQRAKNCELDDWTNETLRFASKCEEPFLIIDDLDKLRTTATVQSSLFNLLECATANEVALIVTTNCSAAELVKRFDRALGVAIVARLQEFCTAVNFSVKMQGTKQAQ